MLGISCLRLNGRPMLGHPEALSFQVATDDQAETDRLWNAIVGNGGQEGEGWPPIADGIGALRILYTEF